MSQYQSQSSLLSDFQDLCVSSDGLAVDGGVGGAAVLMRGDVVVGEKKFHLGSDKDRIV